jgi:hypothetical protein
MTRRCSQRLDVATLALGLLVTMTAIPTGVLGSPSDRLSDKPPANYKCKDAGSDWPVCRAPTDGYKLRFGAGTGNFPISAWWGPIGYFGNKSTTAELDAYVNAIPADGCSHPLSEKRFSCPSWPPIRPTPSTFILLQGCSSFLPPIYFTAVNQPAPLPLLLNPHPHPRTYKGMHKTHAHHRHAHTTRIQTKALLRHARTYRTHTCTTHTHRTRTRTHRTRTHRTRTRTHARTRARTHTHTFTCTQVRRRKLHDGDGK